MSRLPGRIFAPLLLLTAGLSLLIVYSIMRERQQPAPVATPVALKTEPATEPAPTLTAPTPLSPTAPATPLPSPTATASITPTALATATATPAVLPVPADLAERLPLSYLDRFGVTGRPDLVGAAHDAGLVFGSYLSWWMQVKPVEPGGAFFWQMIRVSEEGPRTSLAVIDSVLAGSPGSLWLIGNEPDVAEQDNVTPQRYAEIYHDLYHHIKERDPGALVAIGGVSQPTPLRRAYLDIVLDTYRERYGTELPLDLWNVHAFILREEQDSWGVGIPAGMDDTLAIRYEIDDHIDMGIFRQLILEFRAWMADRGYGDRPLLISEYGFLMPYEYGFTEEEVAAFMTATFDFFRTAQQETGYPGDEYRLVQWWLWYVVGGDADDQFADTYLFDRERGTLTHLGRTYSNYVEAHGP